MGEKKSNYLKSESFPNSEKEPFIITSPENANYNCVAWALGDTENWWDSTEAGTPLGLQKEHPYEIDFQRFTYS